VTLSVKDTTYGISNQLEFIQERIPAVVVYVLHVGLCPTAIFGRRCISPTHAHWVDVLSSDVLNAFGSGSDVATDHRNHTHKEAAR
jgi:hypothetical protein